MDWYELLINGLLLSVSLDLAHACVRVYLSTCFRVIKACLFWNVWSMFFFLLTNFGRGRRNMQKGRETFHEIFSAISIVSLPMEYYSLHVRRAEKGRYSL